MAAVTHRVGRGFSSQSLRNDLQIEQAGALLRASSLLATRRLRGAGSRGAAAGRRYATRAPAEFVYTREGENNLNLRFSLFTRDGWSTGRSEDCRCDLYWCPPRVRRTLVTPRCSHLHSRRSYSSSGPQAEPLYKTKTGYYDVLEVAPSATQAQIKTAYYKQSFLYHPDRNAGSEVATARFSEISEAYSVLGSKTLRKKYDRGLLSLADLVGKAGPTAKDPAGSGARQRGGGRRSVVEGGGVGRGKVYNFDAFFKSHYQEQLRREKEIRLRRDEFLKRKAESFQEKKMDWLVEMGMGVMIVLAAALWVSMKAR